LNIEHMFTRWLNEINKKLMYKNFGWSICFILGNLVK
jgi:hypothetical protein